MSKQHESNFEEKTRSEYVAHGINHLKAKLKALYKSQDTLPKLIEDESIPEQKMKDYFVQLKILLDSKGGDKDPIDIGNIFNKVGSQDATGKVLIVGGPGIGKTTLLHLDFGSFLSNFEC